MRNNLPGTGHYAGHFPATKRPNGLSGDENYQFAMHRHRLHSLHVQDPRIGLPAVELEQRIMISTEAGRQTLPGDGLVEPAAERWTVDGNGLHPKADDPAGKLIHDDQNPVTP